MCASAPVSEVRWACGSDVTPCHRAVCFFAGHTRHWRTGAHALPSRKSIPVSAQTLPEHTMRLSRSSQRLQSPFPHTLLRKVSYPNPKDHLVASGFPASVDGNAPAAGCQWLPVLCATCTAGMAHVLVPNHCCLDGHHPTSLRLLAVLAADCVSSGPIGKPWTRCPQTGAASHAYPCGNECAASDWLC